MLTKVAKMFYTVADMTEQYSYSDTEEIRAHLNSLSELTVAEAMESLSDFFNKSKSGNSIYAVNEFIKKYPEFTFGIYGLNEEHQSIESIANRIIAIYQDNIYDVGTAIRRHNSDIYAKFCRISVYEFPGRYLSKGESIVKLSNPFLTPEMNFWEYLFNNPNKKFIVRKSY